MHSFPSTTLLTYHVFTRFSSHSYESRYFNETLYIQTKKRGLRSIEDLSILVIQAGFEPTTHSLEGCCSIQLSYWTNPMFSIHYH